MTATKGGEFLIKETEAKEIFITEESTEEQQMIVGKYNLIKYASIPDSMELLTKIRYKDAGSMATVSHVNDKLNVMFHSPVSAVAPGQSAVFYEGEDLVGGGIIERQKPILL